MFGRNVYGCHAEYKVVPDNAAIAVMLDSLDFDEAVAISFGALTAQFFLRMTKIMPG
ncbi:MAG: hypothetical protein MO846_08010 [Candidatus Devosia symbiotica]|nr:hypothetical protein [Candidatus Devosia symbiotica]